MTGSGIWKEVSEKGRLWRCQCPTGLLSPMGHASGGIKVRGEVWAGDSYSQLLLSLYLETVSAKEREKNEEMDISPEPMRLTNVKGGPSRKTGGS